MPKRRPSLSKFMARFPDDRACADYLAQARWPHGFVCPECGGVKGWELASKRFTWECAACGRQTSVTAGTVMHRSKVPLQKWFLAAHLVATHSNGVSALQLQNQLGLGSYKTAWLMLQKLRRAMVNPGREPLAGVVEADETYFVYRTKDDPPAPVRGRSTVGKLLVIGAVELVEDGKPGRIRLGHIPDASRETIHGFVQANVAAGSTVVSDGLAAYRGLAEHKHRDKKIGRMAAHVLLPWIHRVFSNLKRWAMGTFHGFRKRHLRRYLEEFVFRWNRRNTRASAFDTLLGLTVRLPPADYWDFVRQRV